MDIKINEDKYIKSLKDIIDQESNESIIMQLKSIIMFHEMRNDIKKYSGEFIKLVKELRA